MNQRSIRTLISFSIVGAAVVAHADVILDTYGVTPPGYQTGGWSISTEQTLSRPFAVTGTYTLTSIELALGNFNANVGNYDISICGDNAGVPGSTLESFSVNVSTPSNTVSNYMLTSTLNPLLTTGTYYVVASTRDSSLSGGWAWNSDGTNADQQYTTDGGATWHNYNSVDVAMRIQGTPAVPEPASMTALAFGAVALIRRRKAQA